MPGKNDAIPQGVIDHIIRYLSLAAANIVIVMAFITTFEVVSRYVFNAPTQWTLDLSIYLLVWYCYATIASLQQQGRHIRVDLITSHFTPRTQFVWDILTNILFLIFISLVIYYGLGYFWHSYSNQEYSWAMWRVLIWPVKLAVPFGGICIAIVLLKQILLGFRNYPKPSDEKNEGGLLNRLKVTMPVYIFLILGSAYLYTVNGALGMLLLMLALLFGGVPIFPALGLVGVVGYYLVIGGESALGASFPSVAYSSLENFALVCLPLYIFVGQAISSSGVSEEIYNAASKWVGHLPGGEAVATILACSIFAAVSTSSVATAMTIGLIAIPALLARKYEKEFSYGLLAAGGTLGIMIPPSGTMIIYSAVTEESLGKLFIAGVIPGILLAGLFIGYAVYYCVKTGKYEKVKPATWKERMQASFSAFWGLLAPLIILGGIYSGVFTPMEAGAIAVVYVLLMVLIRGKMKIKGIGQVALLATNNSTMILSIIVGAMLLGDYMTLSKIPDQATDFIANSNFSPTQVIIFLMAMYVVLGMFLEVISIMLITLPIVYPIIIKLGFDGIWFAVLITLNMEMAIITPPVGLNLYVIQGICNARLSEILKGVTPFFIIMVIWMVVLGVFPSLSTWLPSAMIKR